ncbi:hypothetical protein BH10ACI2_BH10ACI2_23480 [soil metagenome]
MEVRFRKNKAYAFNLRLMEKTSNMTRIGVFYNNLLEFWFCCWGGFWP